MNYYGSLGQRQKSSNDLEDSSFYTVVSLFDCHSLNTSGKLCCPNTYILPIWRGYVQKHLQTFIYEIKESKQQKYMTIRAIFKKTHNCHVK